MADDFASWLQSNGGAIHSDLDFFQGLPGNDRGVVARKAIKEGDTLIKVPLNICLNMPTLEEWTQTNEGDEVVDYLLSLDNRPSPFISTVLRLMHHKAKGEESKYYLYLVTLPAHHDCTLGWTDDEVKQLAGTSITDTGLTKTAIEFDALVRPVLEQRPDLWPPSSCSFEAFVYAAGMVQSRAFHVEAENWVTGETVEGKELFLVPGMDMINHSCHPKERNTKLVLSHDSVTFQRVPGSPEECYTGYFAMLAGRDVAAGEQILHTYGDLTDAQLLQTYGFVQDPARPNPQNKTVRLPVSQMEKVILLLRRHHKPDKMSDTSWISIENVEARLLAGKPLHDDLFKLIVYYVRGRKCQAEATILLSLLDGQMDASLAAPRVNAATAQGRVGMALAVRKAEHKELTRIKNQVFNCLLDYPDDDGTLTDPGPCMLSDIMWEPWMGGIHDPKDLEPEDEEPSEEEDSEEEEEEEEGEESEEEEDVEGEEEGEEEEKDVKHVDGAVASSSEEEAEETCDRKRARSAGGPAADEASLLSASVLPASEKADRRSSRRSSIVSLKPGDPVRKCLKF